MSYMSYDRQADSNVKGDYPNGEGQLVRIDMLGGFQITVGDVVIKNSSSRSYQLWNLMEYLIAFRHKTISTAEMYDALWDEDGVDNPASALKNLVYRIRTVFSEHGVPFAKNVVTYVGGTYQWNNEIPCVVDIERFEGLFKRAQNTAHSVETRIEHYQEAINLYKGNFLSSSKYRNWTVPVVSYYKSMYFRCVNEAIKLLSEQGRYDRVETICQKALIIDIYEESVHEQLIIALYRQGHQSEAINHYKHVDELFMRELGVRLSASLRNHYRQITKGDQNIEMDVDVLHQDLRESHPGDGAFYCGYDTFKSICHLLSRLVPRDDRSVFLVLLTATGKDTEKNDVLKRLMDALFGVVQKHTRRCDVFARFSASQFVLLLPSTSMDGAQVAINRVIKAYKQAAKTTDTELISKLQIFE